MSRRGRALHRVAAAAFKFHQSQRRCAGCGHPADQHALGAIQPCYLPDCDCTDYVTADETAASPRSEP